MRMIETEHNDNLSAIIHYRWAIGVAVLIICIGFQLNGSSIGVWNSYVPNDHAVTEQIQVGVDRPIYLLHNVITESCRANWRKLHLQNGEKCRGICKASRL